MGVLCVPGEGEALFGDRFLDGHFAASEELARERVTAHEQKVKDENSESKVIVIWCSDDFPEFRVLQLRGSIQRDADFARIHISVCRDLKAIAIDKTHNGCFRGYANVALVDVANDVATLVDCGERSRDVRSCVNQESPGGFRGKFASPAFWIVKKVNVLEAGDIFHKKAGQGPVTGDEQSSDRPGRERQQSLALEFHHLRELLCFFRAGRLVIDFRDEIGLALDVIDSGFATTAELRAQADAFSLVVKECGRWHCLNYRYSQT